MNACGLFAKNKEKIQKIREIRRFNKKLSKLIRQCLFSTWYGSWRFYRSTYKKSFCQSIMWLSIKTFNIANYTKYDGYQRGLASMAFKFFDKILQLIKE